jgi:hypothetical protein
VDLVPENSKRYFYAGILAIVFFSLVTGFMYTLSRNPTLTETHATKITLAIQNEDSGTESFSAFIEEQALFSGKQSILTFSSKDSKKQSQLICTINCQREGD